jgi:predicted RNase H-like HicB family nuclease
MKSPDFNTNPNDQLIAKRCEATGLWVGYIPNVPRAHSQAETIAGLFTNLREVMEMLQDDTKPQ